MKPLKYGINKVPGSGTIEMYPDSPIRIRLPERPTEETIYDNNQPEANNPNTMMRSQALRAMMYKDTLDPNSMSMENDMAANDVDEDNSLEHTVRGMSDEQANTFLDEHMKKLQEQKAELEADSKSYVPKFMKKRNQNIQDAIDLLKRDKNKITAYGEDY
jgi:hypothetical protein